MLNHIISEVKYGIFPHRFFIGSANTLNKNREALVVACCFWAFYDSKAANRTKAKKKGAAAGLRTAQRVSLDEKNNEKKKDKLRGTLVLRFG